MVVHIHNIEVTIEHLCDTCQFAYKCVRLKAVTTALHTVEENALDKWRMDVGVEFNIKSCDLYTADPERLEAFANQVIDQYLDELEDNGAFEDEEIEDRLADYEGKDDEEGE